MSIANLVRKIIYLPIEFYSDTNNSSMYTLLKKTGYFEEYKKVNKNDIVIALSSQPDCIHSWILWSQNKRSDEGWYFKQQEENKFEVGHYSQKIKVEPTIYSDIIEACGSFIHKEIEEIRMDESFSFIK